ncbi:hypothetical protein XENORESO_003696 [Xenotaenia resolanae]|uniref:Uncharacterized protein n=1 Tax=Xenotaenia resolanae TaxID=208358 RepID=A0ABV0W063_9TELE
MEEVEIRKRAHTSVNLDEGAFQLSYTWRDEPAAGWQCHYDWLTLPQGATANLDITYRLVTPVMKMKSQSKHVRYILRDKRVCLKTKETKDCITMYCLVLKVKLNIFIKRPKTEVKLTTLD